MAVKKKVKREERTKDEEPSGLIQSHPFILPARLSHLRNRTEGDEEEKEKEKAEKERPRKISRDEG